jgi:hypothetical protein
MRLVGRGRGLVRHERKISGGGLRPRPRSSRRPDEGQ